MSRLVSEPKTGYRHILYSSPITLSPLLESLFLENPTFSPIDLEDIRQGIYNALMDGKKVDKVVITISNPKNFKLYGVPCEAIVVEY